HYVFLEENASAGSRRTNAAFDDEAGRDFAECHVSIGTPLSPNVRLRILEIGSVRLRKKDRFARTARTAAILRCPGAGGNGRKGRDTPNPQGESLALGLVSWFRSSLDID